MTAPCGCCEGTEPLTPVPTANRPGLPALSYRVGTHATFLETMKARLSNLYLEIPEDALDERGRRNVSRIYPLRDLKTRASDDPAIAWLDAWATVGDVLTFYQERIANEGYLRTATERRSILELARLIGYTLRPGVASTVYLAYTLDEDRSVTPPKPTAVTIAAGARSQSVPGPGELPQSSETSEDLEARSEWNNLQVRLHQPQTPGSIQQGADQDPPQPRVYLKGIATNLSANDPLLIDFGSGNPALYRVVDVTPDAAADRTLVRLQEWAQSTRTSLVAEVAEIVARHRAKVTTLRAGNIAIVRRVAGQLNELETHLATAPQAAELAAHIEAAILPNIAKELPNAQAHAQHEALTPLLQDLIGHLQAAAKNVSASTNNAATSGTLSTSVIQTGQLLGPLLKSASTPPASAVRLSRDVGRSLADKADSGLQLLRTFQPALSDTLATAVANAKATQDNPIRVYALRVKAAPFGNNALQRTKVDQATGEVTVIGEWPIVQWGLIQRETVVGPILHEHENVLSLDASYDKILGSSDTSPSWIVIDASAWEPGGQGPPTPQVTPAQNQSPLITTISEVQANVARADYGISGKTTRIKLADAWLTIKPQKPDLKDFEALQAVYDVDFSALRNSAIYAQSQELPLADEPVEDDVCDGTDDLIELDGLYSGLQSGRWLIVSGERTDITNDEGVVVPGVKASELTMLAAVTQDVQTIDLGDGVQLSLPGDKTHTFIQLATGLAYCYKRDTIAIYGNVVEATHGETRNEVLGSGDGSKPLQQFTLRQPPLTFVSAATPAGVDSTLQVRVNDVLWHETDSFAALLPTDRKFITKTDDDGKTTVIFGTGQRGARLPTGQENVKAVYRNGIGKPGNVKAGQISLLVDRPPAVKAVTNPLRASGGADKESRDQARQNAPLAVMALDRLVSTQDYADFARTFAGIGKASAVRLSDGHRQLVHVTIAGADDIPIETSSDLYRNLCKALRAFGDPYLPIQVSVRELQALVISANVRVLPDYQLETVEPQIRATLLDAFGFQRRELGQTVFLSEVISAIQRVAGVAYLDVDVLTSISEVELSTPSLLKTKLDALKNTSKPDPYVAVHLAETVAQAEKDRLAEPVDGIYSAQLAFLTPGVPATLIINEVPA